MVTGTSFETTPPLPSSTVTVNVSVVGPVARSVDREGTVGALAAVIDGPGVRVGRVNVGDVDLASGDQRAVFGNRTVSLAGQDGDVVRTHDRDHDLAGRAISRRNGEGLGQRLARAQALDGRIVVGEVVRPLAIGIDGERAMLASGIRLGDKHGLTGIGVGHVELAAGSQRQVFRDGALVIARLSRVDDRAVISAVDGDGHVLRDHATIAVIDGHGKRLGERFTGLETLDVLVGVVQVVGPVARIIDRERAIRTLAAVVDGPGVRVGRVNVGDVDLASGDQGAIFRDCAVSLAGQDGDIVGAHDRDHDLTGRAISRRNGEGLGQGLASAQALDSRVVIAAFVWATNTASPASGSVTSSLPPVVSAKSSVTVPLSSPG
ncbi:hypothetical protein G6F31_014584 [Rhizopus arrhizus]|nr:hypothetical protein G6F31_014584 [Rhizopus arrhizus]